MDLDSNELKSKAIVNSLVDYFGFKTFIFGNSRLLIGLSSSENELLIENDYSISIIGTSWNKILGQMIATKNFHIVLVRNPPSGADSIVKLVENPFYNLNPEELCLKLTLFGHEVKI